MSIVPAGINESARRDQDLSVQVLKDNFAPKANIAELQFFARVCTNLDLNPFAGQICLIGRNQKVGKDQNGRDMWRMVHKPQITVAGRRVIAARTGRLQGIEGPQWCGPRRRDANGNKLPLVWEDLWDDDEEPYAARVLVWPAGWRVPANGTVKWSEFAQYTDRDRTKLSPFWAKMPAHMLGKVAEALALRRAFPEVQEAMAFTDQTEYDVDDAGIIAEADAVTGEITPRSEAPTSTAAPDVLPGDSGPGEQIPPGPSGRGRPVAGQDYTDVEAAEAALNPPTPPGVHDDAPESRGMYSPDDPERPF